MLRLPEALKRRLMDAGMLALCTWALIRPALSIFTLEKESGFALLLTCLISLAYSSVSLIRRRWMRSTLMLALLAAGGWLVASSPIPKAIEALIDASATFRPAYHIVLLYSDLLLPLFIIVLIPYIRLLMQGEPSFSAPLLLVTVLMIWFAGARQSLAAYIPAMAAIPLLYAYAAQTQPLSTGAGPRRGFPKAVPVAFLIALIALSLTPPYRSTVGALEKKADELRQMINDYFFFTDSRENFTLAAEGYQPMGDKGLGGKPAISNTPVMEVDSDHRVYLRGGILNQYNGRAWYDTLSKERYGYTTLRFATLRDNLLDAQLPDEALRQQPQSVNVTMLSPMPSTLFVPQRLRTLNTNEGMVPYINRSSEMFITRNLQPADAYSLSHEPYVAATTATDALAAQLSGAADEQYDALLQEYTQLPTHLLPDGQVATLARSVVGDETDPYHMALLLREHLKSNYTYTLDVVDAPVDLDFTAHFLFDTRQGYCTYFATAMTVLSRSVGLPARYVEGFVVSPDEGGGPSLITGQNAHAWTEIYIPALGWVTFDATATTGELPPQPEDEPQNNAGEEPEPPEEPEPEEQEQEQEEPEPDGPTQEPETNSPEPSPPPDQTPPDEEEPQPDGKTNRSFWWLWLLLALLTASACVWRARMLEPNRLAARERDSDKKLLIYWHALCRVLSLQGKASLPHETLSAYTQRIAPQDEGLRQLSSAVSALIYGKRPASEQQVMTARLYYQSSYTALPRHKRARLILSRLLNDAGAHINLALRPLTQAFHKASTFIKGLSPKQWLSRIAKPGKRKKRKH